MADLSGLKPEAYRLGKQGLSSEDFSPAYNIIATKDETNGTGEIDPEGSVRVPEGSDQEFTITPGTNQVVEDVVIDDQSAGPRFTHEFLRVATNHSIKAVFRDTSLHLTSGSGDIYFANLLTLWTGSQLLPAGVGHIVLRLYAALAAYKFYLVITKSVGDPIVSDVFELGTEASEVWVDSGLLEADTITGIYLGICDETDNKWTQDATVAKSTDAAESPYSADLSGTVGAIITRSNFTVSELDLEIKVKGNVRKFFRQFSDESNFAQVSFDNDFKLINISSVVGGVTKCDISFYAEPVWSSGWNTLVFYHDTLSVNGTQLSPSETVAPYESFGLAATPVRIGGLSGAASLGKVDSIKFKHSGGYLRNYCNAADSISADDLTIYFAP